MVYDVQSRVFFFFLSIVIGSGTGRSGDRLVTWLISEISDIEFLISMFILQHTRIYNIQFLGLHT